MVYNEVRVESSFIPGLRVAWRIEATATQGIATSVKQSCIPQQIKNTWMITAFSILFLSLVYLGKSNWTSRSLPVPLLRPSPVTAAAVCSFCWTSLLLLVDMRSRFWRLFTVLFVLHQSCALFLLLEAGDNVDTSHVSFVVQMYWCFILNLFVLVVLLLAWTEQKEDPVFFFAKSDVRYWLFAVFPVLSCTFFTNWLFFSSELQTTFCNSNVVLTSYVVGILQTTQFSIALLMGCVSAIQELKFKDRKRGISFTAAALSCAEADVELQWNPASFSLEKSLLTKDEQDSAHHRREDEEEDD